MLEKAIIKDNSIDNFIPITPTKPQVGYIHKEESQQFGSQDYNYDGVNNIPQTTMADTFAEISTRQGLNSDVKDIPVNSANSATDYIGIVKFDVPHIINPEFTDFLLMDVQTNPYTTIQSAPLESLITTLYESGDTDPKVIGLFNGMQALRIPANKFNNLTSTPIVKNFGKYYIKISPKYIESEITSILSRKHVSWQSVNPGDAEGRRTIVKVDKTPFTSTPWGFENNNKQSGRLHGSIIEVWDNSLSIKKQTKISVEEDLSLDNNNASASFVITPDNVGYDPSSQVPAIGDKLRIFPRETYFNPIYVEVDYQNKELDLEALIKFMKNDAARNTKTGVMEIYDDNGIVIDSQGNLNGTVIQAYQISQPQDIEIRRRIDL